MYPLEAYIKVCLCIAKDIFKECRISPRRIELSEEEQIEKLKEVGLSTTIPDVKKKVIDTLASYGDKAIPAVTEIIKNTTIVDTRTYGLDIIKKIKEK